MALPGRRAPLGAPVAAVAAALLLPAVVHAQSSGDGFLFREPRGSLAIRAGWDRATAGSDLFDFVTDELTLKRGSFSSATLGVDLSTRLGSRVDLVYGAGISGVSRPSEFRRFVDDEDRPIEQRTQFLRVPLTLSGKVYLTPRGASYGRLAWVPARVTPWVGAGAGALWYRFRQSGDFVDASDGSVDPGTFTTSGWTPSAHAMAGADFSLSPRLALTTEARYTWGRGPVGGDYDGFQRLDLSGLRATAGLAIRF